MRRSNRYPSPPAPPCWPSARRDDRIVLDLAVGCRPDDLFWLFSTSKPFVALLVHQLAAHGASGLDRPVAAYWPGFGQHGKDEITVRPVLQHRSGLPVSRGAGVWGPWVTADHHQLVRSVRGIERARPRRPPGGGALAEATRPSSSGELDQFLKLRIRWSQGFQLGGPVPGRATSHPVGDSSARETSGRGGSNAWVA